MKVLLLHAFPLEPDMWDAQEPVLKGHEVVAPSLYGRGNAMDAWAESLRGELTGPFDCCVGASMGGGCALALERQAPGLLRALVGLPESAEIAAYCHSGSRSALAVQVLRAAGYEAKNYVGSWHEWSRRDDLPVEA